MNRVVLDIAGCARMEAPCVMVFRVTSLDGLQIVWNFNKKQITKGTQKICRQICTAGIVQVEDSYKAKEQYRGKRG